MSKNMTSMQGPINLKTKLNFLNSSVNSGLRTRLSCLGRLTTEPERRQKMSGRKSNIKTNMKKQKKKSQINIKPRTSENDKKVIQRDEVKSFIKQLIIIDITMKRGNWLIKLETHVKMKRKHK